MFQLDQQIDLAGRTLRGDATANSDKLRLVSGSAAEGEPGIYLVELCGQNGETDVSHQISKADYEHLESLGVRKLFL